MFIANSWVTPQNFPVLAQDQIHVWYASLIQSQDQLSYYWSLLSTAEQAQAKRFHFELHRNRFIATHGILRILLSRYLPIAPADILFSYNPHGKPELTHYPELSFNISHSVDNALFAFVKNYPLGIDIENMAKAREIEGIAARFFSTHESLTLKKLPAAEKIQGFYNAWTRKEAFLKALGLGLAYSLKKVEVSMDPHKTAEIIALHDDALNLQDWELYDLKPPIENFAAALVSKGKIKEIKLLLI